MVKISQNTVASSGFLLGTSIYFMSNFEAAGNSKQTTIILFLIISILGFIIENYT